MVLFCGAGVSRPAGLPGFCGLVEQVYNRTNTGMSDLEQAEFNRRSFDRVLGLLESRIGSQAVRRAVIECLRMGDDADVSTHRSLLTLATTREGVCRLVTTNFDRGFEIAASGNVVIDTAPKLPVPKASTWNSVVYLHGRICDEDPDGKSLVLTSADFGSAYLTERWASRFLSGLFRRFAVLFVGYSVEDPVIRYMMDAFAADRSLGEGVGKAFVLAGCAKGEERREADAWQAKGVIPLLYDSGDHHAVLHQTLAKWADCHSRGLLGKENIVHEHANTIPTRPFDRDPVVSQVLWALREESGHVAHVFAELDPAPPLEWLEVFQEQGLLALPCSSGAAGADSQWMVPLADSGKQTLNAPGLNPISRALGGWITRHLEREKVLDWALRSGAVLHPEFRSMIRRQLETNPPMPAALRQIWKLLGSEATLVSSYADPSTFDLHEPLKSGEWDIQLKLGIIDALSPVLRIKPSIHRLMFTDDLRDDKEISHFAQADVVPRCGHNARLLKDAISTSPNKQRILSDLADDVTSLLSRTMQLFEMMQKADSSWDWSYSDQPSISDHTQNRGLRDWTILLELCRDAWMALRDTDPCRARRLVERWRTLPYPVFRRLCFFAMAESTLFNPRECLEYILEDDGWWLWSIYVQREKFRLLAAIWPQLSGVDKENLVRRVVKGPPRAMFRDGLSEDDFQNTHDREVWLHLSKLKKIYRPLPELGERKLSELCKDHPEWTLGDDEQSEFPVWFECWLEAGEPRVEQLDEFVSMPDNQVIQRLSVTRLNRDDLARWQHLVTVDSKRALSLLATLAAKEIWQGQIWRTALETLGTQKQTLSQLPILAPILEIAPESLLEEVLVSLAWFLMEAAEGTETDAGPQFWRIWDRLRPYAFRDASKGMSDPLIAALNSPSGHLAQALLAQVAKMRPQQSSDLPDDVWERLTSLTKGDEQPYTLARVLLASRLAWLHHLNSTWVEQDLLPFFDWNKSEEAPAVWLGYLWQARVTPELWPRIKGYFLDALREKDQLERAYELICQLFGTICIHRPEWLTPGETQSALRSLDGSGRAIVTRVLWKRLEGAGTQGETLWRDHVGPWLNRVWPKDLSMRDPQSSFNLAMASTYAGNSFRDAVEEIAPLLVGTEHYFPLIRRLLETRVAEHDPATVLKLIRLVVDTQSRWADPKLRELLVQIETADARLVHQPDFCAFDEYLRKHNL